MATKIINRLKPITPMELYLQQEKSTYDSIRYERKSLSYIPSQFAGIFGQTSIAENGVVLEIVEFESVGNE